ncbi:MAG: hypothetical protein RMY29_019070 [Nostoc sp. CreGUA01]|nr:hypothetical protein [Nostoc sp. CreGUA01]
MKNLFFRLLKKIKVEPKDMTIERQEILDRAIDASKKVSSILEGREEIQAIGVSRSDYGYSVKIDLNSPLPKEVASQLPKKVEGVPVETEVIGQVFVLT